MWFSILRNLARQPQLKLCRQLQGAKEKFDHLLPTLTEEQTLRILQALNNKNAEELALHVSKARAAKLQAWRKQNGNFARLEDIFLVEGFARKTVEKFFNNLLTPQNADKTSADTRTRIASFVTPSVNSNLLPQICSTVALRVGTVNVSWSRLELPKDANDACVLTHWQQHEILSKKMHLLELVQRCAQVHAQIPLADCYVLENPQMAQASNNPGNVDQQNINIQRAQIIATLSYALATRAATINEEKTVLSPVYYLRRFLTARLFSTLIGAERVSSESVVLQLMRYYNNSNDVAEVDEAAKNLFSNGNVHFSKDLRQLFANSLRTEREFLGQALLLNLAFVLLVLLQDANSIAAVTRGDNSKSKTDINEVA